VEISRKLIAWTPLLLIAGIAVQVLALVVVIILLIPSLIFPQIWNGPYRWVTRISARMAARALISPARKAAETVKG